VSSGSSVPPLPTFATRARKLPADRPQPFLAHLDELRGRLLVSGLSFALCTVASYFFVDRLIALMAGFTGGFVFTHMTEAFFVRIKIALLSGLFLSAPVFLYEFWRFVGNAVEPASRQKLVWMLPASYLLFALGVACAWVAVLPTATTFLLSYSTEVLKPLLSIDAYVGFAGWLTLAFGVLFQLPLVVFFMVGAGLVTAEDLAHYRKHVIVGLAIVAAAVTPGPDIVSQAAVFVPTYVLYEVSYWTARLIYGRG